MSNEICPKFASCITPCVYGRVDYFFVKDICLSEKYHSCTHYMGYSPMFIDRITPAVAKAAGEEINCCSRLDICLRKPQYGISVNGNRSPIPEYEGMVCRTQEHLRCLFYFTWFMSGRWPDDDMTSLEIKDGPSFKEAVIDRLKGETDGFVPQN